MDLPIRLKPVKPKARLHPIHKDRWMVYCDRHWGFDKSLKQAYRNWEWQYRKALQGE